jgi:malate synthase
MPRARPCCFPEQRPAFEITIDASHPIGKTTRRTSPMSCWNRRLTTIMDCEDSVAAVDAEDKVAGLPQLARPDEGRPGPRLREGRRDVHPQAEPRPDLYRPDGGEFTVKGRSLMLVRNVGHLMTNPPILDADGNEVPEGHDGRDDHRADRLHDLKKEWPPRAIRVAGSVYVVKPKMHGPEEVAFADELFARVEEALGLAANTLKMGIMDEERRTTVNLKECIRAAKTAWSSSTPASSTAPATRSTPRWKPAR